MRVKMLKTRTGADDGFTLREYEEGKEYDLSVDLSRDFIASDSAVAVAEKKAAEPKQEEEEVDPSASAAKKSRRR